MCWPVSGSHDRYSGAMINDFTLAACAEMIFIELPITERVQRIDDLGFEVEIWDWTRHDIDSLRSTGAKFSSMTGYLTVTSLTQRRRRTARDGRVIHPAAASSGSLTQPPWHSAVDSPHLRLMLDIYHAQIGAAPRSRVRAVGETRIGHDRRRDRNRWFGADPSTRVVPLTGDLLLAVRHASGSAAEPWFQLGFDGRRS
jgi:hypothetical protein